MAKRTRSKLKPFRAFGMAVGLFGFFFPALLVIPYWIFVSNFIPSDRLLGISLVLSPVVGLSLLIAILPQLRKRATGKDAAEMTKAITLMALAPAFGFIIFHAFLTQSSAFVMHTLSTPTSVVVVERVVRAGYGSRSCRRPAILEGDTFLMHRRACWLSPEDHRALERGGLIELKGRRSPFGFQVLQYRVVAGR